MMLLIIRCDVDPVTILHDFYIMGSRPVKLQYPQIFYRELMLKTSPRHWKSLPRLK